MPIIIRLDVALAQRKMPLTELADAVGITLPNLSVLKTGKAKAIRFSTLEAICKHLDCQPGDILEYVPEDDEETAASDRQHQSPTNENSHD
jgi:putative transcriptional regulator